MNTANFNEILKEAHAAAEAAVAAKGPENMNACDCGFAWVKVSGTEAIARYCRKMLKQSDGSYDQRRLFGDKSYTRGWEWWKPGNFNGQAIGHHEAGARAFRDVLAKHGISAEVCSRYD